MPKQCGASLIETAIVIAIFGILSAIAMEQGPESF